MISKILQNSIKKLSNSSGVYFFRDSKNKILYIGKATSLKSRVRSYFTKDIEEKRSPLIAKMVEEAKNVTYEKTDSVLEALLLESALIKKHTPKYNSADKDQKSFNFVVITKEDFPKVLLVRERLLETLETPVLYSFGPFPHGAELKEALKIVRKIFPYRDTCTPFNNIIPKVGKGLIPRSVSGVGCFNYQIGLCPGVCMGAVSKQEYGKTISHIKTFFEGNKKKLVSDLEKEMKALAKSLDFEKAKQIKSKIFALKHIQDVALIKREIINTGEKTLRIEAYDIAHISGTNMVGVMTVVENGEVNKNAYRKFIIKGQSGADDTKALKEVLERRLKHTEWNMPDIMVADGGVAQLNTIEKILKENNLNIKVVAVTKDERHKAKDILNIENLSQKNIKNQILLANSEAHRFAINFHRLKRGKII